MKNMKMVMIIYTQALDDEVLDLVKNVKASGYTKFNDITGEGASDPHLGTKIWAATNSMVMVAVTATQLKDLKKQGKELAETFKGEGLRMFVLPMEEML